MYNISLMKRVILTKEQVQELVLANKFKVNPQKKFISRCLDGRYEKSPNLPAMAMAGADIGEIALVTATGNNFGFTVDMQKTTDVLIEIVGGIKNFSFHTDSHADQKTAGIGCGHIKNIVTDWKAYSMNEDQAKLLQKIANDLRKKGAQEMVLHGEHEEGSVVIVRGNYGLFPQLHLETNGEVKQIQTFVFQQSLVNERHHVLAKKLIENKAVKLLEGLDEEYLYEALSDMTELHFFETAKRLASGLPICEVVFDEKGNFEIKDMGIVSE